MRPMKPDVRLAPERSKLRRPDFQDKLFFGQASLTLPSPIAAAIIDHARACYPEEACGLVAGRQGRATEAHLGRNISPTPRVAYELDHETLACMIDFEDAGLDLVAIYHSHPAGPEAPSPTDIARAAYPGAVHLICSLADPVQPVLRGFCIAEGRAREVQLDIPPAIE